MAGWTTKLVVRFADLDQQEQRAISQFIRVAKFSSPFQHPLFSAAVESSDPLTRRYFVASRDGHLVAFGVGVVGRALGRRFDVFRSLTFANGPSLLDASATVECLSRLKDAAARSGFAVLRVRPPLEEMSGQDLERMFPAGEWSCDPSTSDTATMRVDVRRSDEELMAGIKHDTRRRIRRASREGVDVRRMDDAADIAAIYELYRKTAERKCFNPLAPTIFRALASHILKDQDFGFILSSYLEDSMVGTIVVLVSGANAHYVYGGTDVSGLLRNLPIAYPLHYEALRIARAHGCKYYDFGGYNIGPKKGVSQFKSGFQGEVVKLPGGLISYLSCSAGLVIPLVLAASQRISLSRLTASHRIL